MRYFCLFVLCLLISAAPIAAQQPNSWRGLVLDEATEEDARNILGEPTRIKERQKVRTQVDAWLDTSLQYKVLEYKTAEKVDRVSLYFFDGKLKLIDIDLKEKINPNSISDAYGIALTPKVSGTNIAFNPDDYERHQGKVYPKSYPTVYHLIGVASTAYVVVMVGNSSAGSALKKLGGIPDDSGVYPGKAESVQLVSTSLRDMRRIDVLR